jgi:type 2 lantibiotic biosynthesis protein LanM
VPGIVLFLAYLGAITGEARYTQLAMAGVATIQRRVERSAGGQVAIGAFSGLGGILYLLSHLMVLWQKPELLAAPRAIEGRLPELIDLDEEHDLIGGAAGCLAGLLSMNHVAPSDSTVSKAVICGHHLVECTRVMEQGVGWVNPRLGSRPLAGLSHGAAGIAWALLMLSELTGCAVFRQTALAALEYERSLFDHAKGNWPDLRELGGQSGGGQDRFMTAWCHGAPGIGLTRISILNYVNNARIHEEIDAALASTIAFGFDGNHSLCHGALGNLEFVYQASIILRDPELEHHVRRATARIVARIEKDGWLCGVPLAVETPGLMTGLAGIGYGLLRLAAPDIVPSVLMLEPPRLRI